MCVVKEVSSHDKSLPPQGAPSHLKGSALPLRRDKRMHAEAPSLLLKQAEAEKVLRGEALRDPGPAHLTPLPQHRTTPAQGNKPEL